MEKTFSMVGGHGEFSYEQMTGIQAYTIRKLEPLLVEAIKHLSLPEHGPLHIADFGCSTGKNSFSFHYFHLKLTFASIKELGSASGCIQKVLHINLKSIACT